MRGNVGLDRLQALREVEIGPVVPIFSCFRKNEDELIPTHSARWCLSLDSQGLWWNRMRRSRRGSSGIGGLIKVCIVAGFGAIDLD